MASGVGMVTGVGVGVKAGDKEGVETPSDVPRDPLQGTKEVTERRVTNWEEGCGWVSRSRQRVF